MEGIRTGAVYVVATATLAAIAGGGGLGDVIVNQASYGTQGVIAGALMVTALAFLVEGIFAVIQRMLTPRALRHEEGPAQLLRVMQRMRPAAGAVPLVARPNAGGPTQVGGRFVGRGQVMRPGGNYFEAQRDARRRAD